MCSFWLLQFSICTSTWIVIFYMQNSCSWPLPCFKFILFTLFTFVMYFCTRKLGQRRWVSRQSITAADFFVLKKCPPVIGQRRRTGVSYWLQPVQVWAHWLDRSVVTSELSSSYMKTKLKMSYGTHMLHRTFYSRTSSDYTLLVIGTYRILA